MSARSRPSAGLVLVLLVLAIGAETHARAKRPKPDPLAPPVEMKPFVVQAEPITSFGLGLKVTISRTTHRITKLEIRAVPEDSAAYRKQHLRAGMEIIAVDGIDIRTLEGRIEPGSEFNRLFMNRKRGDRIILTISRGPGRFPRLVELTESAKPPRAS